MKEDEGKNPREKKHSSLPTFYGIMSKPSGAKCLMRKLRIFVILLVYQQVEYNKKKETSMFTIVKQTLHYIFYLFIWYTYFHVLYSLHF